MQKAKVYFTSMHTHNGVSLLDKLTKLMARAGVNEIEMERKFVAIKMHFGELGNLSFLRPNFVKCVADMVTQKGGNPFVTDCSTLYVGSRKNALEHLSCAAQNGFSAASCGCHTIIGDGLKGTSEKCIPLTGTDYVKNAKIGLEIANADILVLLSHFKGHELTGFGGALKNLGMGCASKAGKMEQHCAGKPDVNRTACKKCHQCAKVCGQSAIHYDDQGIAVINHDKCVGCGRCLAACNFDAIANEYSNANEVLCCKIAEYAKAAVQDKPNVHINIVMQVSPYCDCHGENDSPIVPDIGMFISFDPVAVDRAAVDACLKATPLVDVQEGVDIFTAISPQTNWHTMLDHAEKIGLGTQEYELIEVK